MQVHKSESSRLKGSSGFLLHLSEVLLLHLLWFWAFAGAKRIAWKPPCVKNLLPVLEKQKHRDIRWDSEPPEVNWLHTHCETFPAFLWDEGPPRSYSESSSLSQHRERVGHVCGRPQGSAFCGFFIYFFPPFRPSSLQRYFEETFWLEVCLGNQKQQ